MSRRCGVPLNPGAATTADGGIPMPCSPHRRCRAAHCAWLLTAWQTMLRCRCFANPGLQAHSAVTAYTASRVAQGHLRRRNAGAARVPIGHRCRGRRGALPPEGWGLLILAPAVTQCTALAKSSTC
jgi:hypothetical protein